MPNRLPFVPLLAALALPAVAAAQTAPPCEVPAFAQTADPREAVAGFLTVFNNLEFEPFRCFLADSITAFLPFPDTPARLAGRAAVEARFRSYFAQVRAERTGPPFLRMVPRGMAATWLGPDAAVVSFTFEAPPQRARRSMTLVRRDGAWRMVHLHGSTVPLYDVVLANATLVDGTGAPRRRGHVAMADGMIAAVQEAPLPVGSAVRTIDVRGQVVAPGFIDLHAHLEPLLELPDAMSAARQGVTFALGGPDGGGPFPLAATMDSAAATGIGINVGYQVGHNTIRRQVMGTANRAPSAEELARMRAMVGQGMRDGAFGLSTGLIYIPGTYSNLDEVLALAEEAGRAGGMYTSHLRGEGLALIEGVAEALEIGRRARVPVVLTHHKAVGPRMWGQSVTTLRMVDSARAAGTDVMVDQYPYTAASTTFDVLLPPWALAGGRDSLRARLAVPAQRARIEAEILGLLRNDGGGGDARRVQFASVPWDSTLNGRTLRDWADRRGVGAGLEAVVPLVIEGYFNGGAAVVLHLMDEGDVRRIMAHSTTMIASDGRLSAPGNSVPHPRNYGTFPRVLGEYVRERQVLTLEEAVRKMTSMPAARLGVTDRGCLRVGCAADVVVFDPGTVRDRATFTAPHQYPEGIPWVFVNGVAVVADGVPTGARPGVVVRKPIR
ncbi:MAG: amidohydrolase family protein [Gemmatimonadetes bacterium]|nr:amidohydrolase family protein [Gemmatimonadota bacterium]